MNFWSLIYIDRDPTNVEKGWGWIEIKIEDCKRHEIPLGFPDSYTKLRKSPSERAKLPHRGNLPHRGRASTKKFMLNLDGELVKIRTQKSLSISAICEWLKTWAKPNTKLVTSSNRTYSIDGDKTSHRSEFIYFILNRDSNAIKIGRTKNVAKRLRTLQTSSPAKLELIKSVQVEGFDEVRMLEQALHKQFNDIRLSGEWFKAEIILLDHIDQM